MKMIITSAVPVFGSRPQCVGSFEESLLSNLEKDLCLSGVERNIVRQGNGLLTSLHPPPWEPKGWTPRGLSPGVLLIFNGDVVVGSLQHLWYSCWGLLHKRPENVGRPYPDHESLDDQRWVHIGNDPDFVCKMGKVLAVVFLLLLPHPEEGCGGWL
ncbi:hypothetical protein BHE74_00031133 [Ensete ventricosum]|nr:hypothetical protein BHE74_00031133 [Ensete ventricosum]